MSTSIQDFCRDIICRNCPHKYTANGVGYTYMNTTGRAPMDGHSSRQPVGRDPRMIIDLGSGLIQRALAKVLLNLDS